MTQIIPAIIPKSFENLVNEMSRVVREVDSVQIDIVDGKFTKPESWPFNESDDRFGGMLESEEGLPHYDFLELEIDMMIEKPELAVDDWLRLGAKALIIHHGSTEIFSDIVAEAHEREVKVGLAVRPSQSFKEWQHLVPDVDFVQCMGNDTLGSHGVELDEKVFSHIANICDTFGNVTIAVDIGVNRDTAPRLVAAGVSKLVAGSAIFAEDDINEAISFFKKL